MLDKNNPKHQYFIKEFKDRMNSVEIHAVPGMKVYRKADETEDYFSGPTNKKDHGSQKETGKMTSSSLRKHKVVLL